MLGVVCSVDLLQLVRCPKHVEHIRSEIKLNKLWRQVGLLFFNLISMFIEIFYDLIFLRFYIAKIKVLSKFKKNNNKYWF